MILRLFRSSPSGLGHRSRPRPSSITVQPLCLELFDRLRPRFVSPELDGPPSEIGARSIAFAAGQNERLTMATIDRRDPGPKAITFLEEYHLATLTIVRQDGTPHVTPVGFTYDRTTCTARVITWADSWKSRHVRALDAPQVAICSVDGGRWLTLSGFATVTSDPEAVSEGVRRYADRYRQPKERDDRVVIEVAVSKIIGRV